MYVCIHTRSIYGTYLTQAVYIVHISIYIDTYIHTYNSPLTASLNGFEKLLGDDHVRVDVLDVHLRTDFILQLSTYIHTYIHEYIPKYNIL